MFIFGNFLLALAQVVDVLLSIAYWLVLIRALISWVNPDPTNPIVQFLQKTTDPMLDPIRRRIPPMSFDISAVIVFIVIIFLKTFLVKSLQDVAFSIGH